MAAAIPLALSFAVFDDWTRPLMVFGLFAVLELFDWSVLEPWLYGSHTGVSPVALLLAAGFWTWLWGFAGLFLAVPMTVCAVVMGKYIPQLKFLQVLLGDEPVLEPHERLYQRLLSSNRDEADSVLDAALRESSIMEVCDAIIVPAMLRAEEDHDRGTLTDARRQSILEHVNDWVDERLELMAPTRSGFANPDTPEAQTGHPVRSRFGSGRRDHCETVRSSPHRTQAQREHHRPKGRHSPGSQGCGVSRNSHFRSASRGGDRGQGRLQAHADGQ